MKVEREKYETSHLMFKWEAIKYGIAVSEL